MYTNLGDGAQAPLQGRKLWGSRARINKLHDKLVELSQQEATSVPLAELYQLGLNSTESSRLQNAQFLHGELAIRMSQRAVDLAKLPYGLSLKRSIERVSTWYAAAACDILEFPYPTTVEAEEGFTQLLEKLLHDHSIVVRSVAAGIYELKEEISKENWEDIQSSIDQMLTAFYTSRIGLRFLMEHHIKSRHRVPGYSGIISNVCKPHELAERAAAEAIELCRRHTGLAPRVNIINKTPGATFTYVPSHVQYMLAELLKNSVRAVSEVHGDEDIGEASMPAVSVVVAKGDEDVTFRVSDEGGGIARSRLNTIFSFLCSTAGETYWDNRAGYGSGAPQSKQCRTMVQSSTPALAGWGVGLPLSRTYARYFGGELELMSMESYGTDVYLHLSALGDGCENLPAKVLASPASRASSAIPQAGTYDPIHRHDAYR